MNLYAIVAAVCHVGSRKLLLFKLLWEKHCRGVSLITQELLLIMFITRYLDLLYLFENPLDEIIKASGCKFACLHGALGYWSHDACPIQGCPRCLDVLNDISYLFLASGRPSVCVPRHGPHHAVLAGRLRDLRCRP